MSNPRIDGETRANSLDAASGLDKPTRRRFPVGSISKLFDPRSVAIIGATERAGSVGRTLTANLLARSFHGAVYPVNSKRSEVLGVKAYARIEEVPECPDVAVIVTPAATVPRIVQQCADRGVRAAIVISAGFRELGPEGRQLEQDIFQIVQQSGIRVIGPNCLGVMNPITGFNATFA
ncbi:MAG: CoA-binding protein, partial [Planctomycetaceae bacterium]